MRRSGALALPPFSHRGCANLLGIRVEHIMSKRSSKVHALTSFGRVRHGRITYPIRIQISACEYLDALGPNFRTWESVDPAEQGCS